MRKCFFKFFKFIFFFVTAVTPSRLMSCLMIENCFKMFTVAVLEIKPANPMHNNITTEVK